MIEIPKTWKFTTGDSEQGNELIQTIVDLTGLPGTLVVRELEGIVKKSGHQIENLTLDQLRGALIGYLESLHPEFSKNLM